MKNKNNKYFIIQTIILLIICLIINFFMNNYYKSKYDKIINSTISNILYEVKEKYPNVKEEELIDIINNSNNQFELDKYGIDINKVSAIEDFDHEYKNNYKINNIIIICIFLIYIILFIINMKKRNKQIDDVTSIIERINNKDYSLDILENSEDELSRLKNELYKITLMLKNEALNKEIEKESIKEGVASISHQIKTPLTSISIMLDNIIEDEEMDPNIKQEFLKDIRTTIDDMNFLVISLLNLSRFDAGVIKLKREKINALNLLDNIKSKLNVLLLNKNINLNFDVDEKINFYGDYNWELEAFTNIIKNSIEYSNLNSNIDIKVKGNYFYVKFIITDYGKGMSNEDKKHIFERFYKVNNNSNSFGIGLSLSKTIIEKDNGFIKVKSELNKGTTFEIKYIKKNI